MRTGPQSIYLSNGLRADGQASHFGVTNCVRRSNATSLRAEDKEKQSTKGTFRDKTVSTRRPICVEK
jgi:hypothetical protein